MPSRPNTASRTGAMKRRIAFLPLLLDLLDVEQGPGVVDEAVVLQEHERAVVAKGEELPLGDNRGAALLLMPVDRDAHLLAEVAGVLLPPASRRRRRLGPQLSDRDADEDAGERVNERR